MSRDSLEQNRDKLRREPHDVLPLCDGGLDHVLGVVQARRVLEELLDGHSLGVLGLAEPALFVPETMTIMRLLEEFKRTNLTAALVVDEFGEIAGIASLTDVVAAIVKRGDGSWLLDGAVDLATLAQTLVDDSIVSDEDRQHYHTLGGLAMVSLRRVPRTGDIFERGRHRFEIVDMDGNRVDRVLVTRLKNEPREEAEH